jgi:DNA-directed RNA polymerase specialized sigma24 family protein
MHVEAGHHQPSVSVVDAPERSAARWAAETLQIMDDLDSVDRAALQLIYSFGMSQAQVAWELGLPETEIRRSVARGMCEVAARLTNRLMSPA